MIMNKISISAEALFQVSSLYYKASYIMYDANSDKTYWGRLVLKNVKCTYLTPNKENYKQIIRFPKGVCSPPPSPSRHRERDYFVLFVIRSGDGRGQTAIVNVTYIYYFGAVISFSVTAR